MTAAAPQADGRIANVGKMGHRYALYFLMAFRPSAHSLCATAVW
jgi:hypothetical protein